MKKTNNKGFSLVELIVVVAIMAVLMVVLAPQYLKYVEKTRLQKDNSAISEIANVLSLAMADEYIRSELDNGATLTMTNTTDSDDATITFDDTSVTTGTGGKTAALVNELKSVMGDTYTTESNTYKKSKTSIVLTVDMDGKVKATAGFLEAEGDTDTTFTFTN